jgi:hypothetical protein
VAFGKEGVFQGSGSKHTNQRNQRDIHRVRNGLLSLSRDHFCRPQGATLLLPRRERMPGQRFRAWTRSAIDLSAQRRLVDAFTPIVVRIVARVFAVVVVWRDDTQTIQ